MKPRIFAWAGKVCVADSFNTAKAIIAPDMKRPFIHDITDELVAALSEHLGASAFSKTPVEQRLNDAKDMIEELQSIIQEQRTLRTDALKHVVAARKDIQRLEKEIGTLRIRSSDEQAYLTKAFLSGEDISETETVAAPFPFPLPSATAVADPVPEVTPPPAREKPDAKLPAISPLADKHGKAITNMANEGFNSDEIAASINEGLGRNDQLNARQVTKILTELKRHQSTVRTA